MKIQKLIILFLFIFITAITQKTIPINSHADSLTDSTWARIINDQTPFYSDMGCTMIKFYLPKSYFVKILELGDDSTRVIYMDNDNTLPAREGYLKTCDFLIFDSEVYQPYLNLTITISADEILFADSKKNYPKTVLCYGDNAKLYGTLTIDGENFCYVYANGYIGYVRKSAFMPFEIPLHPIALTDNSQLSSASDSQTLQDNEQNQIGSQATIDNTMKIIIIIALSITCLSVAYLLFKPKNESNFKVALTRDDDDDF